MQDTQIQFNIRVPEELRRKLKDMARRNRRSLSAEVAYHLENIAYGNSENEKADAQRA